MTEQDEITATSTHWDTSYQSEKYAEIFIAYSLRNRTGIVVIGITFKSEWGTEYLIIESPEHGTHQISACSTKPGHEKTKKCIEVNYQGLFTTFT